MCIDLDLDPIDQPVWQHRRGAPAGGANCLHSESTFAARMLRMLPQLLVLAAASSSGVPSTPAQSESAGVVAVQDPAAPLNVQLYPCNSSAPWRDRQYWTLGEGGTPIALASGEAALQVQPRNPSNAETCPGGTSSCFNLIIGPPDEALRFVRDGSQLRVVGGPAGVAPGAIGLCVTDSRKNSRSALPNVFLTNCSDGNARNWTLASASASAAGGPIIAGDGQCLDVGSGGSVGDLGFQLDLLPAAPLREQAFRSSEFASWGGSVIEDDSGQFHMFAAVFSNHTSLGKWRSNSEILHLLSSTPDGPFEPAKDGPSSNGIIVAPEAHNPTVVRANDGTYLLFSIKNQPLLASRSLSGPWSQVNWTSACNNPAPLVRPGSDAIYVYCHGGPNKQGYGAAIGMTWTPHWNSSLWYNAVGSINRSETDLYHNNQLFAHPVEDPFAWYQDNMPGNSDNYHLLMHGFRMGMLNRTCPGSDGNAYGAYASAPTPFGPWRFQESGVAYHGLIKFSDGTSMCMKNRERPHLLLDKASGRPTHLYTGVCPETGYGNHTAPKGFGNGSDHCFTFVQRIALKTDDLSLPTATLQTTTDGQQLLSYTVLVGGEPWLESPAGQPFRARVNGKWHSTSRDGAGFNDAIADFIGSSNHTGTDEFGSFAERRFTWNASGTRLVTAVKHYADTAGAFLMLEQRCPDGCEQTNYTWLSLEEDAKGQGQATADGINRTGLHPFFSYPQFDLTKLKLGQSPSRLGTTTWKGTQISRGSIPMANGLLPSEQLGLDTGPLVLFSGESEGNDALIISPANDFKGAVMYNSNISLEIGVNGEITSVPRSYSHKTILLVGKGVNNCLDRFGQVMRRAYNTHKAVSSDLDLTVNWLGYWTDNGAYYYGDTYNKKHFHTKDTPTNPNPNFNLECCTKRRLLSAKKALDEQHVPIKYLQMDDWWYYGPHPHSFFGGVKCVDKWELPNNTFPGGLKTFRKEFGVPMLLYAPYFCQENQWSEPLLPKGADAGIPTPERSEPFYTTLFEYIHAHGGYSYEIDFMAELFLGIPEFRQNYNWSAQFLHGMNAAGANTKTPIQFCMMQPSDLLMSIQLDYVTNGRASPDYATPDNTFIGHSSLLFMAVGMRPSKDNFWTTDGETSWNGWANLSNPGRNCELNTIVAAMSTGPVGPSDGAGMTNKTRIMHTCASSGMLLQPNRPMTTIDALYRAAIPGERDVACKDRVQGYCKGFATGYHTVHFPVIQVADSSPTNCSSKESGTASWTTWHVLAYDLEAPFQLLRRDLYPIPDATSVLLVRDWHSPHCANGSAAVESGCVKRVDGDEVQNIGLGRSWPVSIHNFTLYTVTAATPGQWVLLGELSKYVTVASARFGDLRADTNGLSCSIAGGTREIVKVTLLKPTSPSDWEVVNLDIVLDASGHGILKMQNDEQYTSRYVPKAPRFSWETVPRFIHTSNMSGPVNSESLKLMATYPMVTVEKFQGPCANENNATPACFEEDKIISVLRGVKAINPNASTIFYMNSVLDFPQYRLHALMQQDPSLVLRNITGGTVMMSGGYHISDVFDFSNPRTRALYIESCVNATRTGVVDGCFQDRAVDGTPSDSGDDKVPCTTSDCKYQLNISASKLAAYAAGHVQVLADLQKAIGDGPVIANHACGPPHDNLFAGAVSFAQLENFEANNGSIQQLMLCAANRRGVQAHCRGDPSEHSLAAFLIGAGHHAYFGFGPWKSKNATFMDHWMPQFELPLGEPLGDATYTDTNGGEWHRSFKAGVEVTFSVKNRTGTITGAGWPGVFPPQ